VLDVVPKYINTRMQTERIQNDDLLLDSIRLHTMAAEVIYLVVGKGIFAREKWATRQSYPGMINTL
jgi:hypothetical protein